LTLRESKTGRLKTTCIEITCGALAFGAPFIVYIATLAPSIALGDSGELAAAAATLGVGHPSGYPLAMLLGQLFTLAPAAGAAWKVNLASAFAATGAAFILFLILRELFVSWRPEMPARAAVSAAAAALAFAFGRTAWSQAVITEVYAVAALASAAVLYSGWRYVRDKDPRWAYAAALAGGLALGAHFSSLLVTAPTAVFILITAGRRVSWRGLWLAAAFALLGFFIHLYLPLRAAQAPAMNWADTSTLDAAFAHISRRGMSDVVPARLHALPGHLLDMFRLPFGEMGPVAAVAALFGLAWVLWRRKAGRGILVVLAAVTGPAAAFFLVLTLRADQATEITVWFLPYCMVVAALAGAGLFALFTPGRKWTTALAGAAALAVAAVPLAANFDVNDHGDYYFGHDYGANLLRTLEYRGIGFRFEADFGNFEMAYFLAAEGARPDAEFVTPVVGLLPGYDSLARELATLPPGPQIEAAEERFEAAFLPLSVGRGIYYNASRGSVIARGYGLLQTGLLYRVAFDPGAAGTPDVPPLWGRYVTRGYADAEARPGRGRYRDDQWLRQTICIFRIKEALQYIAAGDRDSAFAILEALGPTADGLFEPLSVMAGVYLDNGEPTKAARLFARAADAVPRHGRGDGYFRFHYGRLLAAEGDAHLAAGDVDEAEAAYERSRLAVPDQPEWLLEQRRDKIKRARKGR
jgi:hypothetical protein